MNAICKKCEWLFKHETKDVYFCNFKCKFIEEEEMYKEEDNVMKVCFDKK